MVLPHGSWWRQSQQSTVALGPPGLSSCLNVHRICHHHSQQNDQRYSPLRLVARAIWAHPLWHRSNAGIWWNIGAVPRHTTVQSSTGYTKKAPCFLWYDDVLWWSVCAHSRSLLFMVCGERGSAYCLEGVFCVSYIAGADCLGASSQEPLLV